MTTNELSGRVNHDVGTVFQRTVDDGCEGVVNNHGNIVFVCYLCYRLKVEHVRVRVAQCLEIKHLCVWFDGFLYLVEVARVNDGVLYALIGKCVGDKVVRTTIDVLCCYDVIACQYYVLQGIGDGCCATCYCQACHTTLKGCYAVFEHSLSGVGEATIDVACIAKAETVGCML